MLMVPDEKSDIHQKMSKLYHLKTSQLSENFHLLVVLTLK